MIFNRPFLFFKFQRKFNLIEKRRRKKKERWENKGIDPEGGWRRNPERERKKERSAVRKCVGGLRQVRSEGVDGGGSKNRRKVERRGGRGETVSVVGSVAEGR